MSNPQDPSPDPVLAGLQAFIAEQKQQLGPRNNPSPPVETDTLALQIAHNLRFQHNWSDMRIHYHVSDRPSAPALPRPLITGLPPQRLYVHPDEQLEVLSKQRREGKAGWPEMTQEREWVLPTHLRESWTLRRFADVFDALSTVPPEGEGGRMFHDLERMQLDGPETNGEASPSANGERAASTNPWRTNQPKRLLLATLEDDSTVVYYIVHDGIVKPRQN